VNVASNPRGACQPVSVLTSFSTIRVHLPSDASYRVEARTSFGNIRTDFPLSVAGSLSSDQLNGVLGGGRCEMK